MFKHKKIISAILAVAMLGAMSTSVFAANEFDTASGYLDSCGSIYACTNSCDNGSNKRTGSYTSTDKIAYRIKTEMSAVNRNTGATLVSGVDNNYNVQLAIVSKNVAAGTSVTVYGTHQVWGISPEYWGEYTTVYD